MSDTILALSDSLPLTCTRTGTCCHGKTVCINPWELAQLANAKGITPREFRDRHCDYGGIRLLFNNPPGYKDLAACSQYIPGNGCSVYNGRPLVCRLYPLGRQSYGSEIQYLHRGNSFTCLDGCTSVLNLPKLTVGEYLRGQDVSAGETVSDTYLEIMQRLADGAFALLFESGLAASGDMQTLTLWLRLGNNSPQEMTKYLGIEWIDRLMLPPIKFIREDPRSFCEKHFEFLQTHAQESFGLLDTTNAIQSASGIMMGLALHLGRALGANPAYLIHHWITAAKDLESKEPDTE